MVWVAICRNIAKNKKTKKTAHTMDDTFANLRKKKLKK